MPCHVKPSLALPRYAMNAMKWLLPTLALLMPGAAHAASYNLTVSPASPPPPQSGVYYITPGGDDTKDGQTIATAWATPNHRLNCSAFGGDVLHVQPGTYRSSNFHLGRWGPVGTGCQPGTFRTIECDGPTIHSCIVDDASSPGFGAIWISSPYWIVKGFEATANHSARDPCLSALNQGPSSSNKGHHIVFMNNWAHDCYRASGGSDYVAYIAFMSYHSAYSSTESGISYYELAPVDTYPGTHVFGVGLFIFKAQNPPRGTDGECFIFDDWDHKQSNSVAYTMRGVIEQSIFAGCGSNGVEAFSGWASSHYLLSSTLWGNSQSTSTTGNALGEVLADSAPPEYRSRHYAID